METGQLCHCGTILFSVPIQQRRSSVAGTGAAHAASVDAHAARLLHTPMQCFEPVSAPLQACCRIPCSSAHSSAVPRQEHACPQKDMAVCELTEGAGQPLLCCVHVRQGLHTHGMHVRQVLHSPAWPWGQVSSLDIGSGAHLQSRLQGSCWSRDGWRGWEASRHTVDQRHLRCAGIRSWGPSHESRCIAESR